MTNPTKKSRRKGKDSIFIDLFHQPKYAVALVNALNPALHVTEKDITFVTLRSVLMIQPYNDLGLLINDKLLICSEAQSTWSLNILVRMFMYLAETYHRYIQDHKEMNLYGSKKVTLPRPECYVIYTGDKKKCPRTLSLAKEFFEKKSTLDLKIKVLKKAGKKNIIEEYVSFCRIFDQQVNLHGQNQKAIEETLRICENKRILLNYLNERAKEVQNIMTSLFSQEEVTKRYGYERFLEGRQLGIDEGRQLGINEGRQLGINEGRQLGIDEGINNASENIALTMLKEKMDANIVAKCTKLPLSRILELSKAI